MDKFRIKKVSKSSNEPNEPVDNNPTDILDNKDEFKSKLQNIDLSDLDNYRGHIKSLIKDALKEDEVIKVEVPIAEEVEVEEIEEMVIEKPVYSRKRNYKVDKVEVNENVENE